MEDEIYHTPRGFATLVRYPLSWVPPLRSPTSVSFSVDGSLDGAELSANHFRPFK